MVSFKIPKIPILFVPVSVKFILAVRKMNK